MKKRSGRRTQFTSPSPETVTGNKRYPHEHRKKSSSTSIEHLNTIISDLEDHISKKQDFVGFILIALGIEFLGSFFDTKDFNDYGQSDVRFKNGLRLFKHNWYKNKLDWMFKEFRGPLIHQYRTGNNIYLTSLCKNSTPLSKHRTVEGTKTVFVLEQLFEDFKEAINSFKTLTQKQNSLDPRKIFQEYTSINTITTGQYGEVKSFEVSGVTQTSSVHVLQPSPYQSSKKSKKDKKKR